MGLPLTFFRLMSPVLARNREQAAPTKNDQTRPAGRLIWLHAPKENDQQVILDLIAGLREIRPDLWFLITTSNARPADLPENCYFSHLPADNRTCAAAFVEHWQPDVMVWLSGQLAPAIMAETAQSGASLYLLDTGDAFAASHGLRWWPGLRRATLRLFDGMIAGDPATKTALRHSGAHWENIEITGVLEKDAGALPCHEAERDTLARLLDTRPVWLAAGINIGELEAVLAAHGQAMRRAHRLLLIIVPIDAAEGDLFTKTIRQQGHTCSQRSDGGEPEPEMQVYLADTEDEYGLWYRLAPVAFIGQTLANRQETGPNPFDAAALGSVVLHGPGLTPYQMSYDRLGRAGASQQVTHSGELALAVEALLAPDKAAEMAHAAWQISTSGAEALERAVEMLDDALNRRPDTP